VHAIRHLRSAALQLVVAVFGAVPADAQQTTAEVRVRVLDRASGEALSGVALQLAAARAETGGNGEARLARVPIGTHTLTAARLGYAAAELEVAIARDTLLVLALDVEAIPLESIRAEKRMVTIRGNVRAADTGERLPDAEAYAGPTRRVYTNRLGRFRLDRIPADDSIAVMISAFRYIPVTVVVAVGRDTTLEFSLQPDPVGRAMVVEQMRRLDLRVRRGGWSQRTLDRAAVEGQGGSTAHDVVRRALGLRMSRLTCLFIDDRQSFVGEEELHAYSAEEIERVEILDSGTMVRIYTGRFVQRMVGGRQRVAPILLVKGMGRPICN
jgi:hypothetical protein